jgi:hypothetical protein
VNPLFEGLVDDAGLFPPTSLSMTDALARHRAVRHPVLTGRFLCPASRLGELPDGPLTLGLILDTGDPSVLATSTVASVEIPVGTLDIDTVAGWVPPGLPGYLETVRGDLKAIDRIAAHPGLGAKIRCGGVRPELVPSVQEVAAFIVACTAAQVPFKATAGLHHAVRSSTNHGFLNLLLAVCAAVSGRTFEIEELLASTDATALADAARSMPPATALAARRLLVAYGSCSITTPLDDLSALGLLEERA